MRMTRIHIWARALSFALLAACSSASSVNGTGVPATCTFKNPIATGADPWVIRSGPNYYLAESRDNGIYVYRSTSLTSLKENPVKVWTAPATGWNETNIWAPELHHINGLWYIYYAGGRRHPDGTDAPFTTQRAGVLQSVADDPQSTYVDKGMLYTGDAIGSGGGDIWAIDLTVGQINGQLYAVWSGWDQNSTTDKTPQNLYIARMSDPLTISTNRVMISAPEASWEQGPELNLEEGPEFLEHAGQEFIIYSTNDSWLPTYRLGQLRLISTAADPLNPASFVKSSGPVFSGASDVYGVGHASFTTSPDGTEDWIVYHTKVDPAPGWNRDIRTQKFIWNADGSPNFGVPVATGGSIPMPAGQCK
jgi:GH43 family beta-xylosidase